MNYALTRSLCFLTPGTCFLLNQPSTALAAAPSLERVRTCAGHGSAECARATDARAGAAAPHGNELFGTRLSQRPRRGASPLTRAGGGIRTASVAARSPRCARGGQGGQLQVRLGGHPTDSREARSCYAHVAISHGHLTWPSHCTAVSASGGLGWWAWLVSLAGDIRGRGTVAQVGRGREIRRRPKRPVVPGLWRRLYPRGTRRAGYPERTGGSAWPSHMAI